MRISGVSTNQLAFGLGHKRPSKMETPDHTPYHDDPLLRAAMVMQAMTRHLVRNGGAGVQADAGRYHWFSTQALTGQQPVAKASRFRLPLR